MFECMSHSVTPSHHRDTAASAEAALDVVWGVGALLLLLPALPLLAVLWVVERLRTAAEPARDAA